MPPGTGPRKARRKTHVKTKPAAGKASGRRPTLPGTPEARLLEALEQQAATSEILRVISSSPTDAQPVFDAIVRSAARLCGAEFSAVARFADGLLHLVAVNNLSPEEAEAFRLLFPRAPGRGFAMGRAFVDGRPAHVEDVFADSDYDRQTQGHLLRVTGYRTFLGVPILRAGAPIGVIGCARRSVQPFTAPQIGLVKTFAEQAVIAIENVRLFTEARERNRELTDSLEQQTATGEILRVISGSPTDAQPVFDTIARNARRLCDADSAAVFTYDGELVHLQSLANVGFAGADALRHAYPAPVNDGHATGRAIRQGRPVHIEDAQADRDFNLTGVLGAGVRTVLAVPMLRDGAAVGIIVLHTWTTPRPFPKARSRCSRPSRTRRSSRSRTCGSSRSSRLATTTSSRPSSSRPPPGRSCGSSRARPPTSSRSSTRWPSTPRRSAGRTMRWCGVSRATACRASRHTGRSGSPGRTISRWDGTR